MDPHASRLVGPITGVNLSGKKSNLKQFNIKQHNKMWKKMKGYEDFL